MESHPLSKQWSMDSSRAKTIDFLKEFFFFFSVLLISFIFNTEGAQVSFFFFFFYVAFSFSLGKSFSHPDLFLHT